MMGGTFEGSGLRSHDELYKALCARFPDAEVRLDGSRGLIAIAFRGERPRSFNWNQAQYLAHSKITVDDLCEGRLPVDWPPGH